MKSFSSPYGIRFQEDGHIGIFPAIEIFLFGKKKEKGIRALFHIDSGATTSVIPASDAVLLGISRTAGEKTMIRGVGGSFLNGYKHTVKFQFLTAAFSAPVIFIDHPDVPRILGREGIFSKFGILFDESKRKTAFLNTHTSGKVLDAL